MVELMTIGYEGMEPGPFLELLAQGRVERVVDVRELAMSRRKGFAKTALAALLNQAGIGYTHLPALGCPREIRHAYREDGGWARYKARFLAYLATRDADLLDLGKMISRERCCLLCFEADYNFCHRQFVAARLAEHTQGLTVKHLTGPVPGPVVELTDGQ